MPVEHVALPNGKVGYKVKTTDVVLSDGPAVYIAGVKTGADEALVVEAPVSGEAVELEGLNLDAGEIVFNTLLHPHGFHGHFVPTSTLHGLAPGDVFHTKSGKVFQVDKHTDKGTKVKTVEKKTGALKGGYTVLPHTQDVELLQKAKAVGSVHPIGELPAGTHVTTNKGKKFVIKKHGKWTTVLPVDDAGTVKGKHTVLPQGTQVTIHHPDESLKMTPGVVEEIANVAAEAGVAYPPLSLEALGYVPNTKTLMDLPIGTEYASKQTNGEIQYGKILKHENGAPLVQPIGSTLQNPYPALVDYVPTHVLAEAPINTAPTAGVAAKFQPGDLVGVEGEGGVHEVTGIDVGGSVIVEINGTKTYQPPSSLTMLSKKTPAASDAKAELNNAAWDAADQWLQTVYTPEEIKPVHDKAFDFYAQGGNGDVTYPAGWSPATKWAQAYADAYDDWLGGQANGSDLNGLVSAVKHGVDAVPWATGPSAVPALPASAQIAKDAVAPVLDNWNLTSTLVQAIHVKAASVYASSEIPEQLKANNNGLAWTAAYSVAIGEVLKAQNYNSSATSVIKSAAYSALTDVESWPEYIAPGPEPSPTAPSVNEMAPGTAAYSNALANHWVKIASEVSAAKGLPVTQTEIMDAHEELGGDETDPAHWAKMTVSAAYKKHVHDGDTEGVYTLKDVEQKIYKPGLTLKLKAAGKKFETQQTFVPGSGPAQISDAKKVQESLPTKFKKEMPKTYEEGVGEHTRVVIRNYPGGLPSIVRVSPDGNEQMLENYTTYQNKTQLRLAARAHAGAHEQIDEETRNLTAPPHQDLKAGDLILQANGNTVKVDKVYPDGKLSVKYAEVTTMPDGTKTVTSPTSYVYPLDPAQSGVLKVDVDEAPIGYAKVRAYYRAVVEAQGGFKDTPEKTVRKAAPNKYSPYLHSSWNPETLIGGDAKNAVAAMKGLDYLEITPRQPDQLRFINRHGGRFIMPMEDGKVTGVEKPQAPSLHIEGSAKDLHAQLTEVMSTGGDLSTLDPQTAAVPEAATSFVRGLVYDMAVGKKKGIVGTGGKVKSDEQYRQELDAQGLIKGLSHFVPEAEEKAPSIQILVTASKSLLADSDDLRLVATSDSVTFQFPGTEDVGPPERAVLWSILKRRGMAALAMDRNKDDLVQAAKDIVTDLQMGKLDTPAPDNSPFNTMADYVKDNIAHWGTLADQQVVQHDAKVQEAAKAMQATAAQFLIDEHRATEGTVKEASDDFQLPTWDQAEFKPQTHEDIWNLVIQDPHGRDVPGFYTGGLFQDGVLMHRKNRTDGKVPQAFDGAAIQRLVAAGAQEGANSDQAISNLQGSSPIYAGRSYRLSDGATKTIEYVHHSQIAGTAGGAPTSQRGVLRMTGYTPQEAAIRLQELGLVGDLEPEVPFDAVMRGPRRHGSVDAIHPAYIRGEAPLPQAKRLLRHGIAHAGGFLDIKSGGLKSIAERWRLGIHKWGSSPSGDMRSGIDHCLFNSYLGGGVGGSDVRIFLRPSALLRRDIVMSQTDYGGSPTRYSNYRSFLNQLQAAVGEPNTNLYESPSPAVRQHYLTQANLNSDAEFNIGPQVPIEDWEVLGVADPSLMAQIDALLDQLLASGEIKARPKVVPKAQLKEHQRSVNMGGAPAQPYGYE